MASPDLLAELAGGWGFGGGGRVGGGGEGRGDHGLEEELAAGCILVMCSSRSRGDGSRSCAFREVLAFAFRSRPCRILWGLVRESGSRPRAWVLVRSRGSEERVARWVLGRHWIGGVCCGLDDP